MIVLCFIGEGRRWERKEEGKRVSPNSAFPLDIATDFGQTAAKLLMVFLARLILKNLGSSWLEIGHKFLCTFFCFFLFWEDPKGVFYFTRWSQGVE